MRPALIPSLFAVAAAAAAATVALAAPLAAPPPAGQMGMDPPAAPAPTSAAAPVKPSGVPLVFKSGTGAPRGSGVLTPAPTGVMIHMELSGLTPGWHAIHFHSVADCSDPELKKSGAHIQHMGEKKPHGLLNPDGPDAGDLPNIWAAADGTAHAEVFSTRVSAGGEGGRPALMDADGSALIVHASPDDGVTQPIGGAGARVACALIVAG